MAGAAHLSTANLEKRLRKERQRTLKLMKSMPKLDAYTYLYSGLDYLVKCLTACLADLKQGHQLANQELKRNPQQLNRSKSS